MDQKKGPVNVLGVHMGQTLQQRAQQVAQFAGLIGVCRAERRGLRELAARLRDTDSKNL